MRQVEKKKPHTNGKVTTYIKSRYCRRCDANLRWQCKCPNNKAMAWQRENVFHSGKRYRGKDAWKKVYLDEIKYNGDSK